MLGGALFFAGLLIATLYDWENVRESDGLVYAVLGAMVFAGFTPWFAMNWYDDRFDPQSRLTLTAEDIRCVGWPRPVPWRDLSHIDYGTFRQGRQLAVFRLDEGLDPIITSAMTEDGNVYCQLNFLGHPPREIYDQIELRWKASRAAR